MHFLACSPLGEIAKYRVEKLLSRRLYPRDELFSRRTNLCNYMVSLIGTDCPRFLDSFTRDHEAEIAIINKLWDSVWNNQDQNLSGDAKWRKIFNIADPILLPGQLITDDVRNHVDRRLLRCPKCKSGNHFFVLVRGDEQFGIPVNFLLFLDALYQIDLKRLPLHAAGVLYRGGIYIFSGVSGTGKSTIVNLSRKIGAIIVDEDQVLLRPNKNDKGIFFGEAWGGDINNLDNPLRAIFFLYKDKIDWLSLLGQTQVASLIIQRHTDIMGNYIGIFPQAFHLAADIARNIPGYNLHFRKSPDFWKLIDQLPFIN